MESLQEIIAEMTEQNETTDRRSTDCASSPLAARFNAQRVPTPDPLIKIHVPKGITDKAQPFQRPLTFFRNERWLFLSKFRHN